MAESTRREKSAEAGYDPSELSESLEQERRTAFEDRDASRYYTLCATLGVEPEDYHLFEQGAAEHASSEKRLETLESLAEQADAPGREPQRGNVPRVWGIRKGQDIAALNYRSLEFLLRGINNLEMPFEMMAVMNPDEILAKFYAAGFMKHDDAHIRRGAKLDFMTLYRNMDDLSYGMKDFFTMSHGCNRRFSSARGEQRKRLEQLSPETKQAFVDAFYSSYRPSITENSEHPRAYWHPNIDGNSRGLYINQIYRVLMDRWVRAEEQRNRTG
ncbi:hypothetical protein KY359_02275 [Candidatus Woesearchaeota archaeon]|nr:hypothetical protein [Candidatus Woesearchaeota archaeon]